MSTLPGKKPAINAEQQVWLRPEPAARRPRHTRDDIAAAALRIADREGIDAVSMRRVAADLDAGTMTLYHYVSTKAELLALLSDAVMGELLVEGEPPADWRQAIRLIAGRTRDTLMRHPWMLNIADLPFGFGPNSVRHFEQSLQATAGLSVTFVEKLDIIALVDEYTFGYCKRRREMEAEDQDEETLRDEFAYLQALVDSGGYPQLAGLMELGDMPAIWHMAMQAMNEPARFERNLDHLLAAFGKG